MKKLIFILSISLLFSCNQEATQEQNQVKSTKDSLGAKTTQVKKTKDSIERNQELATLLPKFRIEEDKMNDAKFYTDKTSTQYANENAFFCYISTTKVGSLTLRLKIQYTGNDWLFI